MEHPKVVFCVLVVVGGRAGEVRGSTLPSATLTVIPVGCVQGRGRTWPGVLGAPR